MRLHIELDDDLVARIDELAGPRGRSRFIRHAIHDALERSARWAKIRRAIGSIQDVGHEWDDDPADWVRRQRSANVRHVG